MKFNWLLSAMFAGIVALGATGVSHADTIKTETAVPISASDALKGATMKPVKQGSDRHSDPDLGRRRRGGLRPVHTNLFKNDGLNVTLSHEDDFAKQVRNVFDGKTTVLAWHLRHDQRGGRNVPQRRSGPRRPQPAFVLARR